MVGLLLACALAQAAPLPPPPRAESDADYRRYIGFGAAASVGIDLSFAPVGAVTGEVWLLEALMLGVGARYAEGERYFDGGSAPDVAPIFTWGARVLSVHRLVGADIVGRHSLDGAVNYNAFGATVEYRASGPHLARVTVLRDFGTGAASVELGYTFRWEH